MNNPELAPNQLLNWLTRGRRSLSARQQPREARSVRLAAGRNRLCGGFWRGLGKTWVYRAY